MTLNDWLRARFGELYLSRADWRANPLNVLAGAVLEPERWVGLVMHHDVIWYAPTSNREDVIDHAQAVQRARPDLFVDQFGRPEWPYSWGIGEHTNPELAWVVEGRGLARTGAHTENLNSTRYGIVLFGNYVARPMTPGMERAFRVLGAELLAPAVLDGRGLAETIGHRQVVATACPGISAFASIPRLQPPFASTPPPLNPSTNPPMESEMELNDPIDLRKLDPAAPDGFTKAPSNVRGALEFSHWHAQLAEARAKDAAGWAHQAAQSAEAIAVAIAGGVGTGGVPTSAETLSLALRAVLTPELLAAALVELVRSLPIPGGGS